MCVGGILSEVLSEQVVAATECFFDVWCIWWVCVWEGFGRMC